MSKYEQKNGTGTIWKNDKYEKGGNQPYARGTVLDLEGNKLVVTLWIPKSDRVKGFNMTIQEPYKEDKPSPGNDNFLPEEGVDENSLPF